jgi:biotin operon repressor
MTGTDEPDTEPPANAGAYTMLPDVVYQAVKEKVISRDAGWLYAVMLRHRNRKRGDNIIWPSREVLAGEMGISKASNVDKYVKQLETAGFIVTTHQQIGRMKTRNMYTLMHIPSSSRSPNIGTTERPAETQGTPAQHVVPTLGLRSPNIGTQVVPTLGPEPDEVHPEEKPSSSRQPYRSRIAEVTGADDDEISLIIKEIQNATTGPIRNLSALIRSISDQDLCNHHQTVRDAAKPKRTTTPSSSPQCPLHRGSSMWACNVCRGHIKGGDDPYAGQEQLRPDGWLDAYPEAQRLLRRPGGPAGIKDEKRIEEEVATTPAPPAAPACSNSMCRGGVVSLGASGRRPCSVCSPTGARPTSDQGEPLVLGELANVRQVQPRQRPSGGRSDLAERLAGIVKGIDRW